MTTACLETQRKSSLVHRALLLVLALLTVTLATAAEDVTADSFWYARAPDGSTIVRLHYFYSPTCPHCKEAKPLLDSLPTRYPWVSITQYSVKDNRDNARFYYDTGKKLGVEAISVPGFAFCRQLRIGYDVAETTGAELIRALEQCHAARTHAIETGTASPSPTSAQSSAPATSIAPGSSTSDTAVYVPMVGRVDAQSWSLPLLTLTLAGVDAFNPCAFFVLLFLLSLLVYARSRARMLLVGGTFVLFSGLIYFIFMAAWLNIFLLLGELRVVTIIAAFLALTAAAINIKDYFAAGSGPSLSIPESAKPGLFRRMREIVASGAVGPMMAGTVVLAVVANSYELLCTAGFPMVFTRALTLANLTTWQHYGYLALYNIIYVLPLLAIVLVFTYTMGRRKLSESEGRTLKLASGYMMLGFGLLLLSAPQLLTNAVASIGVLLAAVLACAITVMLTRGRQAPAH